MKTNRRMNGGGKLRRSQYEAWAEVLAKYVDAYAREGVRISRMSVQNEPMASQVWDSCLFSAEEEAQFAAAYLRPALDASGHGDVKLFAWDHNTDKILSRVQSTFGAPVNQAGKLPLAAAGWRAEGTVASDAFAGVAFHWYAGDHFEQVDEVARRWPDKELLFTEGCVEYTRGEDRKATQERKAEQYAHAVIGSLNAGAAGFIDWNLLLNEKGGPNHARNFCEAPLMYDRDRRELVANRSFFYMAHFSRFAPVGSRRFLTSRYTDDLETVGLPASRWVACAGGAQPSCQAAKVPGVGGGVYGGVQGGGAQHHHAGLGRGRGAREVAFRAPLRSCCGLRRIWFGIRYLRCCLRRFAAAYDDVRFGVCGRRCCSRMRLFSLRLVAPAMVAAAARGALSGARNRRLFAGAMVFAVV